MIINFIFAVNAIKVSFHLGSILYIGKNYSDCILYIGKSYSDRILYIGKNYSEFLAGNRKIVRIWNTRNNTLEKFSNGLDIANKSEPHEWKPFITKYPECTYDWCSV